ncbi:MAG: flagellar type III secretion system protein FliR [Alphaproteobacteria bacterium]|nr:flagellar type III secretion system protein FliR [Alphaproteobacteria bacterium]
MGALAGKVYVVEEVFAFLIVFARVGSIFMLMPGISEMAVSPRIRLTLALLVAGLLTPLVSAGLPPVPAGLPALLFVLGREILIGIVLGTLIRLFVSALQIAGTAIAMQTGLGFVQSVDPTQGTQGALVATFLTILGTTLVLATDLHLMMIAAVHDSYSLFPAGADLPLDDVVALAQRMVSGAYALGMAIAAPFLIFGLLFYFAMGILSRLMPQLHVFFLAMPLNILLSFAILSILIGTLMVMYLDAFEAHLARFLAG